MKRYKSDYFLAGALPVCNALLSLAPGIVIMAMFLDSAKAEKISGVFLGFCIAYLVVLIGLGIFSFIAGSFAEYKVCIDENTITVKDEESLAQSMRLEDVSHVMFDQGKYSKYYSIRRPCLLTLSNADASQSLSIRNPSVSMICELCKRLKNVKFEYYHFKFYIIRFCIVIAVSIIACVLA